MDEPEVSERVRNAAFICQLLAGVAMWYFVITDQKDVGLIEGIIWGNIMALFFSTMAVIICMGTCILFEDCLYYSPSISSTSSSSSSC